MPIGDNCVCTKTTLSAKFNESAGNTSKMQNKVSSFWQYKVLWIFAGVLANLERRRQTMWDRALHSRFRRWTVCWRLDVAKYTR